MEKRFWVGLLWLALWANGSSGSVVPLAVECLGILAGAPSPVVAPVIPTVEWRGQQVPIPLGIDRDLFAKFLHSLEDISGLEAVVLFGSRTHFEYGYPPSADSDLDVLLVSSQRPTLETRIRWIELFIPAEIPMQVIYSSKKLSELVQLATFTEPKSRAEDRARYEQSYRRDRADWKAAHRGREAASGEVLSLEQIDIGKQAILLLYPSEHAGQSASKLRELGYDRLVQFTTE